jgi:hypothetical protein
VDLHESRSVVVLGFTRFTLPCAVGFMIQVFDAGGFTRLQPCVAQLVSPFDLVLPLRPLGKKFTKLKISVLICSTNLFEIFLIIRRIQRYYHKNA